MKMLTFIWQLVHADSQITNLEVASVVISFGAAQTIITGDLNMTMVHTIFFYW